MVTFITMLLIVILAGIVFHDLKYMTIPLYLLLPVLLVAAVRSALVNQSRTAIDMAMINILGTTGILLLACLILFILKGRIFNPVNSFIGTGDLLFLPVLCISLSPVNYLVFFIGSSLLMIMFRLFYKTSGRFIPLAGMQSFILACILLLSEIVPVSFFDDQPLLNLIL